MNARDGDFWKITSVAFPRAIEPHLPIAGNRQLETIFLEVGAAEIYNHDRIITLATVIPTMVADDKIDVVLVEHGCRIRA